MYSQGCAGPRSGPGFEQVSAGERPESRESEPGLPPVEWGGRKRKVAGDHTRRNWEPEGPKCYR